MRWKGVVFDFDGVLLDSQSVGCQRFVEIARSLDLPVSDDTIGRVKKIWGTPGAVLVKGCWPDACTDTFMHQWEKFDGTHPIPLFSGIQEMIYTLSATRVLTVLTSRGWSTHFQLSHHGIDSFFAFVCTLDDSPMPKPHPRSIEPLLDFYGNLHDASLFDLVLVGDSVDSDYGLAQVTGIDFVAASWGNNSREDFLAAGLPPEYIADSMEHLLKMLTQ